jgi:hypothetical protein
MKVRGCNEGFDLLSAAVPQVTITAKVRAALERTGLLVLLDFQSRYRLGKRNFKLVLAA